MTLNPYQSPLPDIRHDDDPTDFLGHGEHSQNEAAIRWTLRALRVIRLGDSLQLVCVSALALQLLVMSPSAKTLSTLPSLVVLGGIGGGVVLSFLGLILLTSQKHRQHSITLLAIILHVVGSIAITSFLAAMIRSQSLRGLLPLFGASAFAMLLTSKALVAMIIQPQSVRTLRVGPVRWSHLAVICYAFCVAFSSALSLNALPANVSPSFALTLIFVFALAATAFRVSEITQAITSLAATQS